MIDFDDDFFDFNAMEQKPNLLDVCGLVLKMKSKKRQLFNIPKEVKQIEALVDAPPKTDECFKFLSVGGGFSSIAFINYIASKSPIEELMVSTFRIGQKQFLSLENLQKQGRLKEASFITSSTQERTDDKKGYNYFEFVKKTCDKFGWKIKIFDNHSKLILARTKNAYFVIETSSNLNENPKMEQFSFENDKSLYEWYKKMLMALMEE